MTSLRDCLNGSRRYVELLYSTRSANDEDTVDLTSSETTENSSLFNDYIYQTFSQSVNESSVSFQKKLVRYSVYSVFIFTGYLSWYPLALAVIKSLNINNIVLRTVLAGGSWITNGSLHAWGTLEIADAIFRIKTPEESAILNNQKTPCLSVLHKVAVLALGFFATLPNAYFSYALNDENIIWPIIYILGSWSIFSYAIYNMFKELELPRLKIFSSLCPPSFFEQEEVNRKKLHIEGVLKHFQKRILSDFSIQQALEQQTDLLAEEYGKNFVNRILDEYRLRTSQELQVDALVNQKGMQYSVKFLAIIFTTATLLGNGKAAYLLASDFFSSIWVRVIITTLALSPTYLFYSVNRDCFFSIINKIAEIVYKVHPSSISSFYLKKPALCMKALGAIFAMMSMSATYIFAREIFPEDSLFDWSIVIAIIINCFALTLLPMLDLSEKILEKAVSIIGPEDVKKRLKLYNKIDDLCFVIKECDSKEFKKIDRSFCVIEDHAALLLREENVPNNDELLS